MQNQFLRIAIILAVFVPAFAAADHLMIVYVTDQGALTEVQIYFLAPHKKRLSNFALLATYKNYTTVSISPSGDLNYVYLHNKFGLLSVSEYGELTILELEPTTRVEYEDNRIRLMRMGRNDHIVFQYFATHNFKEGKIYKIGTLDFDYHDTNDFRAGRIKCIEDLNFRYYTVDDFRYGKIREIGKVQVKFYTGGDYRFGKICRIGEVDFDYYLDGKIAAIEDIDFYYDDYGYLMAMDGREGQRLIVEVESSSR